MTFLQNKQFLLCPSLFFRAVQLRRIRGRPVSRPRISPPPSGEGIQWAPATNAFRVSKDGEPRPLPSAFIDDDDQMDPISKAKENLRGPEKYKVINAVRKKRKHLLQLNFDHIPIIDQVVLMFPSQGAQHLQMGKKVIGNPSSARLFEEANEFLKFDLLSLCLNGPINKLDQTFYAQMALFVSCMAAFEKLKVEQPDLVDRLTDCAGFSIGEICALVAAEVLSFSDALNLVKVRAQAMEECSKIAASGMLTIRTCAASNLIKALKEARDYSEERGEPPICDVASFLFCHVKVVGGTNKALHNLRNNAKQYKIQVLKSLPLYGAFHTKMMEKAASKVAECLGSIELREPRVNVYSNFTGKCHTRRLTQMRTDIARQVNNPVKWEQIMQILFNKRKDEEFPSYFEVGPGRELGTILHQIGKKASRTYVNYPA
ncbi:hypothetical protein niasHT_005330 [Heterodera trifolii]|uniref:Malonyl-CoA:ACP transacylase (MAT) domain-containing protein n=1 Tax=Heterodera trifolii TaxID=157864 RepID=A0ABD2M0N4_9BILA